MRKFGAAAAMVALLSGCATVKTYSPAADTPARGVSYYMPRKDMKITAERTILKLEDAEKKVAAASKATDEAEAADKAAAAELKAQEALLATLTAGTPAWSTTEAARAIAAGKKVLTAAALNEAKAELALAKADQSRVQAAPAAQCVYSYSTKLELLAAVPDHDMRFAADFSHNVLRDDDGKLAVTADGLLTSSNVVAADRTGDIIVELAGAVAGFAKGGGSLRPSFALPPQAALDCGAAATKFVYQFDPVDFADANAELRKAKFPIELDLQNMRSEGPSCLSAVAGESETQRGTRLANCAKATIGTAGGKGALFYRSAVPVTAIIRQCDLAADGTVDCTQARPIEAALVLIPQLGPVSYIPMRSSAFVKTVDDVTFSDGSITAWNATRPSEALEVVRLPVRILTAIISVPAQIFSLRVDLSDKTKALAASQQAQISAQEKLTALKACLAIAERDGSGADACLAE